jgi:hypothetical protein
MNINRKIKFWYGLLGVGLIFFFAVAWVLVQNPAVASPLFQNEQALSERALGYAQAAGLRGTPTSQKAVRMTLGGWARLVNAEPGKDAAKFALDPDRPVFVLAVRGDVQWNAPGAPRPGQTSPEHYDNITVVIDIRTGNLLWVGSNYPDAPMPIPVP